MPGDGQSGDLIMFGTNPIAKVRTDDFLLHSMFYTIQGEGPFAGKPAIFVRLAGCNLRCTFCDTEFDDNARQLTAAALIIEIAEMRARFNCDFVVITGGEPMLQPISLLIDAVNLVGCRFQIETAGSVWPKAGLTDWRRNNKTLSIVCSPKTPTIVTGLQNADFYDVYWKYIVKASEPCDAQGLPAMSTQTQGQSATIFRPKAAYQLRDRIFIQACDEGDDKLNAANLRYAVGLAMEHGYRLSLQQHKVIGVD